MRLFIFWFITLIAFNSWYNLRDQTRNENLPQLGDVSAREIAEVKAAHVSHGNYYILGNLAIIFTGVFLMYRRISKTQIILPLVALSMSGCGLVMRPFEPVKLEVINTYEEGFLIPYTDSPDKQQSSHTEEFLKKNLVYKQQVRIPQQWVPLGYEWPFYNGEWRDAASLIKVNKSPVTREWTADKNTGTSDRDEAIWCMTSDQVEFSIGWTCTARIATREDAIKFLSNYPNGELSKVMDAEIRSKIQSSWTIMVTDLPMETLKTGSTPYMLKTIDEVKKYFAERGISIVNLGITGGFVYRDPKIIETMVELFNSEQKKQIAKQKAEAIITERKGVAEAILLEKTAEADAIKLVADAKAYEIEKAAEKGEIYIKLKELEIAKERVTKWDGQFPYYFMGTGDKGPEMLLSVPTDKQTKTQGK